MRAVVRGRFARKARSRRGILVRLGLDNDLISGQPRREYLMLLRQILEDSGRSSVITVPHKHGGRVHRHPLGRPCGIGGPGARAVTQRPSAESRRTSGARVPSLPATCCCASAHRRPASPRRSAGFEQSAVNPALAAADSPPPTASPSRRETRPTMPTSPPILFWWIWKDRAKPWKNTSRIAALSDVTLGVAR